MNRKSGFRSALAPCALRTATMALVLAGAGACEDGTYHGATGWTTLNAVGDRRYADFDFWAIRQSGSTNAWTRVAGYETRSGTLSR